MIAATLWSVVGFLVLAVAFVACLIWAIAAWYRSPDDEPIDLRRSDDVHPPRQDPSLRAWRSTWIHANKWPPDDRHR